MTVAVSVFLTERQRTVSFSFEKQIGTIKTCWKHMDALFNTFWKHTPSARPWPRGCGYLGGVFEVWFSKCVQKVQTQLMAWMARKADWCATFLSLEATRIRSLCLNPNHDYCAANACLAWDRAALVWYLSQLARASTGLYGKLLRYLRQTGYGVSCDRLVVNHIFVMHG